MTLLLDNFTGTFWALLAAAGCFLLIPAIIVNVDAGDMERACSKSGGVQQVHSVTYPPAISFVVCKDGSVKEVN